MNRTIIPADNARDGVSALLRAIRRHRLISIFVLAFGLRLAATALVDARTDALARGFEAESGREFSEIARHVAAGEGFWYWEVGGERIPSAYMPPGYVFFLVPLFRLFGEGTLTFVMVQCINAVFAALACVSLCGLCDQVFGSDVGSLAGLLMAIYPAAIYMSVEPHAVSLYVLVNILLVWALTRQNERPFYGRIALAGALAGVLALFRAEVVYLIPLFGVWMFATHPRKIRWRAPLIFAVVAISIFAPWTLRNYLVFHRFVPIHTITGYDLARGHNPNATGTGRTYSGRGIGPADGMPEYTALADALPPTNDLELRKDEIYKRAALEYIRSHPWETLKVTGLKLFYFVGVDLTHPKARSPLYWFPWLTVLTLAGVGVFFSIRDHARAGLLYFYLILYTAIEMIFFVLPRHRLFVEPFVLAFAAYGVSRLARSRRPQRMSELAPGGLAV